MILVASLVPVHERVILDYQGYRTGLVDPHVVGVYDDVLPIFLLMGHLMIDHHGVSDGRISFSGLLGVDGDVLSVVCDDGVCVHDVGGRCPRCWVLGIDRGGGPVDHDVIVVGLHALPVVWSPGGRWSGGYVVDGTVDAGAGRDTVDGDPADERVDDVAD
ncbi:hypothetical protein BDK51DRAFT_47425 [Blyttiomyces helicus]|uniref:Uncharacterized protein n=1 Tax=Blyttiomyces helicus TaxID=388810 RepID=A0A4P9W738_9FUNG|nr:hypothetical protein BDK51DRAFT_47425 [Blyttiomyces helicus]|eukprot:RKO85956.1 hypothetical protein BDK51DRAFT_47425 [Blyttiomyces helicus]